MIEIDIRLDTLRGANLSGANLWSCSGNMREIKNIAIDTWVVVYTNDIMQIGCRKFPIETWRNFSDDQIDKLDSKALEWWKRNKEIIFMVIEQSPALKSI